MLLDQSVEKQKTKLSGNHQLLKGSVFAVITLLGFSFLFAFVNMDWKQFSPLAPFMGIPKQEAYVFYFTCFCFFICSTAFSFIFFRNNLQPTDLLLRFAILLVIFILLYLFYLFLQFCLQNQFTMIKGGILFLHAPSIIWTVINAVTTFGLFYFTFCVFILILSKLFFDGYFGTIGYAVCFLLSLIFYFAVLYLHPLQHHLSHTKFPVMDFVIIVFFTLIAFGSGILAGVEKKTIKHVNRLKNL